MLKKLIEWLKKIFGKGPEATPKGGGGPGSPRPPRPPR